MGLEALCFGIVLLVMCELMHTCVPRYAQAEAFSIRLAVDV